MRERYFSALNQRPTAVSAKLTWFEIQLLTITTPFLMGPELPSDASDEPMGGELENEDLCSEHTVRVLGHKQASSRQEACLLYLKDKGFETLDQFLDAYSGFQDQTTELIAQDNMDAWVKVDSEEYLESFI